MKDQTAIKPVSTADHCTMFPDGWWGRCCEAHDIEYGGLVPRAVSDETLMQCIVATVPATGGEAVAGGFIAIVVYIGVRLFGRLFYRRAKP